MIIFWKRFKRIKRFMGSLSVSLCKWWDILTNVLSCVKWSIYSSLVLEWTPCRSLFLHIYCFLWVCVHVCLILSCFLFLLIIQTCGHAPRSELWGNGPDFHYARAPPSSYPLSALSQVHPAGSSYQIGAKWFSGFNRKQENDRLIWRW